MNLQPSTDTSHLRLRPSHLGIGLLLVSDIFRSCKVTLRRILRSSKNEDIRRLYKLTSTKNIRSDEMVESAVLISDMVSSVKKCCDKILESSRQNSILQELLDLKKQTPLFSTSQLIVLNRLLASGTLWYHVFPKVFTNSVEKVLSCVCPPK